MDRLCSQGWDMRAAALEVMDRFSDFLRRWVTDQEELKRISHRVEEFFRQLEEESLSQGDSRRQDLERPLKARRSEAGMILTGGHPDGPAPPAQGRTMTLKQEVDQNGVSPAGRQDFEAAVAGSDALLAATAKRSKGNGWSGPPADPLYFCRTYLPHYFSHGPAPFHHELVRLLEAAGR